MRTLLRLLDANLNRAREALRVLEDLARFHRDDAGAARELKEARHALDREARPLARELVAARDSVRDVGRDSDLPVASPRPLEDVGRVNVKRAAEALRVIEEVSKGRHAGLARAAHRVRYLVYTAEAALQDPRRRLGGVKLYVLADPSVSRRPLARVVEQALRGGADMVQLRQKPAPDLGLARELRAVCRDALFIVNDRADVALACGADGVHVGREDLPVAEARKLGAGIVGATTHSTAEARRAKRDGADYLSCGPMFPTPLKPHLPARGRDYLAGMRRMGLPFFCIGGITPANVRRDFGRVAVCAAVIAAKDPAAAARAVRRRLT